MIRLTDLEAYKARRREPRAIAKREPASMPQLVQALESSISDLANKIGQVLEMQMRLIHRLDEARASVQHLAESRDGIPQQLARHQFVDLATAARHMGLTRPFLEEACENGDLPFVW